jgi:cytochrome c oxidase subunit 2
LKRRPASVSLFVLAIAGGVSACAGEQSAFDTQGLEADRTLLLTWVMFIGAAAIFVLVLTLTALAIFGSGKWRSRIRSERTVIGLGLIFPVVVLSVLLIAGFSMIVAGPARGADAQDVRILVTGEQWWWRIVYETPDGRFETANELKIPAGRPITIQLESADVIHSFWAPAYAGKVDLVPGRTNEITLLAKAPGVRRGQCAEYCGGAHALMSFYVVALDPEDFEAWLAAEGGPPVSGGGSEGERLFRASGCGACHAIRSTPAAGKVGPDLTHVGGRLSLGAGILETTSDGFAAWIGDHRSIKPENRMPPFEFLSEVEVRAIADYLAALE